MGGWSGKAGPPTTAAKTWLYWGMGWRRWLERLAIVVAVIATMATSTRTWRVDATLPADDATGVRRLVVEASKPPIIRGSDKPDPLEPLEPAVWPGHARYLLPRGVKLAEAYVEGGCAPRFLSCGTSTCGPDAFIRVVSIAPATTWSLDVDASHRITTVDVLKQSRFRLTSSHPVRLKVVSDVNLGTPLERDGYVYVSWAAAAYNTRRQPHELEWSVRATIEGACPDDRPCEPPAEARLVLGDEELVDAPP